MTAVEWFWEKIKNTEPTLEWYKLLEQSKEMEKQHIMEAWLTTKPITFNGWKKEFEEYYNEKFKK